MAEIIYLDGRGVFRIFPASPSTRHRLGKREVDPFPPGQLIGGKRYWKLADVLEWLARQDNSVPKKAAARDDAPEDAPEVIAGEVEPEADAEDAAAPPVTALAEATA